MFGDLPKYSKYASNPSPWLGELPAHWSTARTKSVLSERVAKGYTDEPLLAATQSHGVIRKSDYGTRTVTASKDLHLLKLVEVGDFVISLRSFQGGIERCHHRGIISPAYTVLTANDPRYRDYLTLLFKSAPFVDSLTLAVTGIREGQNIDYSTVSVDRLPVPPVDEQFAIVKYIAHAKTRIDKAIVGKRRLISLVREQAACRRADMLGNLGPVQPLSTTLWDGPTNGVSPEVSEIGDLRTFSLSAVRNGVVEVRDSDLKYVNRSAVSDISKYALRAGDVLVVRGNGNLNLVGRAGLVGEDLPDYIYPDLLMRLRFRSTACPEYMVAILNSPSVRKQIENRARTAVGSYKVSGVDVRSIRVPLPNAGSQKQLVRDIHELDRKESRTTRRLDAEITLLQEFSGRLIADVVTGQVDVRAIAATLPDAPEAVSELADESIDELTEIAEVDDA